MKSDLSDRSQDLFSLIGEIIVEFQFIENILNETLVELLKLPDTEDRHRVAAAMSYRQKVDWICDIYPSRKLPK